jgi:hypothetical protein
VAGRKWDRVDHEPPELTDFEAGLVIGLLIGEVHFGGDQRQPQVTLKLREKDMVILEWVQRLLPGGKLYGPYSYAYKADGKVRTTYQLMFRGRALRQQLIPFLDSYEWAFIAPRVYERYLGMKSRYGLTGEAETGEPLK